VLDLDRFTEGKLVNKSQLIDTLAARFEGNRKQAAHALDSVLDTITREVAKGEKVAITGFGSFQRQARAARWVRNPRTGERIKAKATKVPKFSPGADLKAVVSGARKLPKLTLAAAASGAKAATGTAKKTTAKKAPATKTAAKKAPATKTAAKKAPATKTAAKKAPAKKATATKTAATKTAAKKAPATKSTATKSTAKKAPATKTATAKKAPAKTTAAKKAPAAKTTAKRTAKKA